MVVVSERSAWLRHTFGWSSEVSFAVGFSMVMAEYGKPNKNKNKQKNKTIKPNGEYSLQF